MRALITGVTGNVGRACKEWLDDSWLESGGWDVVGVSRGNKNGISLDLLNVIRTREFIKGQNPFDLVIMAHGIQYEAPLDHEAFLGRFNWIIETNLHSAVELTHQLITCNKLNDNALIIYCSSIQATQPRTGRGPYAIAKAGLEALAKTVAVEQANRGIRAVALRLGQLDKTMAGIEFTEEQMKTITDRLPLPLVPCDEVAKLCLDLYGLKSLSGEVINFDSAHRLNVWP